MQLLKNTITCLFLFLAVSFSYAQRGQGRMNPEKMKAEKIAFLTQKMDLMVDEAQKFWPLYNEFDNKREKLRTQKRETMPRTLNIDSMPDAAVTAILDKMLQLETEELNIRKEYHEKFKKVLTPKKMLMYYRAEHEFRDLLLWRLKKGRRNKHRGGK